MYYLLIEAAGVRQASRIHREWHDRFIINLDTLLGGHGFRRIVHDADLFLFDDHDGVPLAPEDVADTARMVLAMLRDQGDNLLDYVVIVDFFEPVRAEIALARIERLLRFVRVQNAAYVTATVVPAVEPVLELSESGKIFLVRRFRTEGRLADQSYQRYMVETVRSAAAGRAIERSEKHDIWIITDEISRTVAALRMESSVPTFVVQCDPEQTSEELLHSLVRQLVPHVYHVAVEGEDSQMARTVDVLLDRFSRFGDDYLASAWLGGELELVVRIAAKRLAERVEQPLVILEAVDMARETVLRHVVDVLTTPMSGGNRYRLVAVSTSPPEIVYAPTEPVEGSERWETRDTRDHLDDEGPARRDAAISYWVALHRPGSVESESSDDVEDDTYSTTLRRILSKKHQQTLHIIQDMHPVLAPRILDELYPQVGISLAERARIMKDLEHIGIIDEIDAPRLHRLIVPVLDEIVDGNTVTELGEAGRSFLREKLARREITLSPTVWELLRDHVGGLERNRLHHDLIQRIAAGGSFENFERYTSDDEMTTPMMQLSETTGRLKLNLRDSRGPYECVDLYNMARHLLPLVNVPAIQADAHLGLAEFFLARREYAEALRTVKDAAMLQQSSPGDAALGRGAAMSHLLMARIMFAQRRLADAGQYLGFAREEAERDIGTSMIARGMDAIRLFLEGNLSRSSKIAAELLDPLVRLGYTDWFVLLWFLMGRINYEFGDYRDAEEQFAFIRRYCESCGMDAPQETARAWETRSRFAVEGTPEDATAVFATFPNTPETLLFRAEVFTRYGRFDEALPLLETALEGEQDADRWPRLGVCWDNGFASIEDLIIAQSIGSTELLRIIRSYYAWTLAHLGRQEEAVPIFYALTRGNDGSSIDPYTGLYNYLYSSVLPNERSGDRDDRITILGRSVKLIQERTSRIDEYRDKMRYLRQNTWNQQLMQEARHHNLV